MNKSLYLISNKFISEKQFYHCLCEIYNVVIDYLNLDKHGYRYYNVCEEIEGIIYNAFVTRGWAFKSKTLSDDMFEMIRYMKMSSLLLSFIEFGNYSEVTDNKLLSMDDNNTVLRSLKTFYLNTRPKNE